MTNRTMTAATLSDVTGKIVINTAAILKKVLFDEQNQSSTGLSLIAASVLTAPVTVPMLAAAVLIDDRNGR